MSIYTIWIILKHYVENKEIDGLATVPMLWYKIVSMAAYPKVINDTWLSNKLAYKKVKYHLAYTKLITLE